MRSRHPSTGAVFRRFACIVLCVIAVFFVINSTRASTGVHTSWLWHLHQPIYWPDRAPANHAGDHYQNAWDTLQLDQNGFTHPSDTSLQNVFDDADRLAGYQYQPNSTLSQIGQYLNSGAQVNYSGALMENVQSLAQGDPSMGYSTTWYTYNAQARGWTTTGGKPRMDLTNFTYHHCIAPFVSDETLEMDILIDQRQQQIFWNSPNGNVSRGYFPAETCFSEHIIPTLVKLGIAWSVVGNNHLTRSCADFPLILGQGGEACDIPNKADQINPAQGAGNYITRGYTSLGCSPTAALPFGFQMHYARYVDPATGQASTLIVVPADQTLSWADSEGTWDLGLISPIAAHNDPTKPSFLLLAHDGDNAWSGGDSYYNEWVEQFAGDAVSDGYEPSTVEQFLSEFPPSTNDVVHVEDGGWVDAAGDFGSPVFVNWHWPPSIPGSSPNVVDPSQGVSDKADVWRTIIATENRVKTAQQIENTLTGYTNRIDQIRDPGSFGQTASAVELGWHYYLAGLDSGFVYFGCTADECWRPVIAQSNAVRNVDSILAANPIVDTTPPTVFIPQRWPYNPGTTNFGVEYSYKAYVPSNSDFWVWTYAYDVSGITNVTLLYRSNGSSNPPTQDQFKTYAGGANTGPWVSLPMTQRSVAALNTLLPPKYIADYYYTKVTGLSSTYVDYYVSATDSRGNTFNSPIQHVYVAQNAGAPPPPPTLSVSTSSLFPTTTAGQNAASQSFNVWNAGTGTVSFTVATSGQPWLSVTPPGGSSNGTQDIVQVSYSTSALATGTYTATITISAPGGVVNSQQTVAVTLTVSPSPYSAMAVAGTFNGWNPDAANMQLVANDTWQYIVNLDNVTNMQFKFAANGSWTTNWGGTTQTQTVPFSSTGVLHSVTNIIVSGIFDGTYEFTFSDLPPYTYTVTNLSVNPLQPALAVSTSILSPSVTHGQNAPGQSFQVWDSGGGSMPFTVTANQSWLSVNPASASTSGTQDTIQVTYNTAGLATGTYTAAIIINAPTAANTQATVNVALSVDTPTSPFNSMTVAGTFNGWNPTLSNMTLIANDTWQGNLNLTSATNIQFKFAANGNWSTNWGGTTQSQIVPFIGTGVVAAVTNILVNGALNGLYQFTFNDQTLAYSLVPLLGSPYSTMTLAGTFNNWNPALANMQLVTNDLWQCTVNLINVTNVQFKFAANGTWTANWGCTNLTPFTLPVTATALPASATNILLNGVVNGAYQFTFNDQSLLFTINAVTVDSVGDGIPDWWRAQFFSAISTNGSTTNFLSCATCDADGTGQNNLFKYVAGLDPTNPASVFMLVINAVTNQAAAENLIFGPTISGRLYTPLTTTDLTSNVWLPLSGFNGPNTNASQVSVTDVNATQANKYYRIQIAIP